MSEENQTNKERILVEYLLGDRESFITAYGVLKDSYFEPPLNRVVKFTLDFFNEYRNLPNLDIIEAETGVALKGRSVNKDERQWVIDEVEHHCASSAMIDAVIKASELVADGKNEMIQDIIREALSVKIDKTLGTDLFEDPEIRIELADADKDRRRIGIDAVDDMIDGVIRGGLYLYAAATSVGKSVMLANTATCLSKQKLDSLIVSVEMDEASYSRRMDSIVTGLPIKGAETADIVASLAQHKDGYGRITTKRVGGRFSVNDLRILLQEYNTRYGKYPDVLLLDYLDIFANGANTTGMSKFDWDEYKTHAIRDLMQEFNMYGFTAAQLNRDGYGLEDVGPQHIQGGISKTQGVDAAIAMTMSEEDIENDQIQLRGIKVRDAAKTAGAKTVYRCPRTLRITDNPSAAGSSYAPKSTASPLKSKVAPKKEKTIPDRSKSSTDTPPKAEEAALKGKNKLRAALKMNR